MLILSFFEEIQIHLISNNQIVIAISHSYFAGKHFVCIPDMDALKRTANQERTRNTRTIAQTTIIALSVIRIGEPTCQISTKTYAIRLQEEWRGDLRERK